MKLKRMLTILFIAMLFSLTAFAQGSYELAMKYKAESKYPEAFSIMKDLLKEDSANVDYLHTMSFICQVGLQANSREGQNSILQASGVSGKKGNGYQ